MNINNIQAVRPRVPRSPGLVVSAISSGSGKTLVSSALCRSLRRRTRYPNAAKVGPDFIDPGFLATATGRMCFNLDTWAMRSGTMDSIVRRLGSEGHSFVIEGVMGLFDGALAPGTLGHGRTSEVAKRYDLPVLLVVNARSGAESMAAAANGLRHWDQHVNVAGIVCNQVASVRHEQLLSRGFERIGLPVWGMLPPERKLSWPSRYLGLESVTQGDSREQWCEDAADWLETHANVNDIETAMRPARLDPGSVNRSEISHGDIRIAIARDSAFAFIYPHVLDRWIQLGYHLDFFSPLAGEDIPAQCDVIYLPGGYPEQFAGQIANRITFFDQLRAHKKSGTLIYGECGGYLVLGRGIQTSDGSCHKMAGLLPIETSFLNPKRTLGYRLAKASAAFPARALYSDGADRARNSNHADPTQTIRLRGHLFHYARQAAFAGNPLFVDSEGQSMGAQSGSVAGSFFHIIDTVPSAQDRS